MGCDIHDYCEVLTDIGWKYVGEVFDDPYQDGKTRHPYDSRNYCLFGLLAGVRDSDIPPISEPRGIPPDTSIPQRDFWDGEGHSYSHLTLKEILDYPLYDELVKREGTVSEAQYVEFKKNGKPSAYCGGCGGGNIFHVSNEEMDSCLADREKFVAENAGRMLHERERLDRKWMRDSYAHKHTLGLLAAYERGEKIDFEFYTRVEWMESVRDCVGKRFFEVTLKKMAELSPDPEKVRLVFFFDN